MKVTVTSDAGEIVEILDAAWCVQASETPHRDAEPVISDLRYALHKASLLDAEDAAASAAQLALVGVA